MKKKYFIFIAVGLFVINEAGAQNSGILPINGFQYVKRGIWAKSILARMNGQQLMGNRIPLNTEIEINLQQLSGFATDKQLRIFPTAFYSLLSAKGDTLQKIPNLLLLNQTKGFGPKDLLKGLSMKFSIAEGSILPNSKCMVSIRLKDQKGKNQLELDFPVSISYPSERIPLSKLVPQVLKSPVGSTLMSFGLTVKTIDFKVDTAVEYNRNMVYLRLELSKIGGTDVIGMLQGRESFWVYDSLFNEIKITERLLKDVGGAMEGGNVNCKLQIPFRSKKDRIRGQLIRYRWDGLDKSQALDIVMTVK